MKAYFSKHNKIVDCRSCGKKTHSSINGDQSIELCRPCYEQSGMENDHNDGHHDERPNAKCKDCQSN